MSKRLLSIMLISLPAFSWADTHIVFTDNTSMKIVDGVVAIGDGQSEMQFRSGNDEFVVVDYDEKTYMVVEKESIKNSMNSMMAQIEEQLAAVPPEQREMVKKMMEQRMPAMAETKKVEYSIKRTGDTGTAAGFDCKFIEMLADGQPEYRLCVASSKETGIPSADVEVLQSAMNTMRDIAESIPFAQGSSMDDFDYDEIGGMPIIHIELDNNQRNEVLSISTDDLDPITIPEGFRLQRMEDMMR